MSMPQMTQPGAFTEDDWTYYLSFENPFDLLKDIGHRLKNENRYIVDERFQKLLFHLYFDQQSRYQKQALVFHNQSFYRARIYKEADAIERFSHPEQYGDFGGYSKDQSGAPPKRDAKSGRTNPEGISYLYVATDIETALKEVRAQPEEIVSVATVELLSDIFVANFTSGTSGIEAGTPKKSMWANHFALIMESLFQSPKDSIGGYYLCQYISEYAKVWGFSGIAYRSSFSQETFGPKGINIAIFNPENCNISSSKLYLITQMRIETIPPIQ